MRVADRPAEPLGTYEDRDGAEDFPFEDADAVDSLEARSCFS